MPELAQVIQRHRKDGVGFVAIGVGGNVEAIAQRAPRFGLTPTSANVEVADEASDAAFEVTSYPVTFLLTADGRLLDRIDRGQDAASFGARLDAALVKLR